VPGSLNGSIGVMYDLAGCVAATGFFSLAIFLFPPFEIFI
jgi:hypothetical protein